MSAVILLFVGLGMMALGYFVYSKFIAERSSSLTRTSVHPLTNLKMVWTLYPPTNSFSGATISPPSRALRPSLGRLLR